MLIKLNCIITDDEPLARKGIENLTKQVPFLQVAATCSTAIETIHALKTYQADFIFLDIQMPKLS